MLLSSAAFRKNKSFGILESCLVESTLAHRSRTGLVAIQPTQHVQCFEMLSTIRSSTSDNCRRPQALVSVLRRQHLDHDTSKRSIDGVVNTHHKAVTEDEAPAPYFYCPRGRSSLSNPICLPKHTMVHRKPVLMLGHRNLFPDGHPRSMSRKE